MGMRECLGFCLPSTFVVPLSTAMHHMYTCSHDLTCTMYTFTNWWISTYATPLTNIYDLLCIQQVFLLCTCRKQIERKNKTQNCITLMYFDIWPFLQYASPFKVIVLWYSMSVVLWCSMSVVPSHSCMMNQAICTCLFHGEICGWIVLLPEF